MQKGKILDQDGKDKRPKVHAELEGFELKINALGELVSTYDIDKINEFLNRTVEDKKLKNKVSK